MGFFPEPVDDTAAALMAKTLFDALKGKGGKIRTGTMKGWIRALSRLYKEFGEEMVNLVVDWYIKHKGEDYVPIANSGETFALKFPAIKRAMDTEDECSLFQMDAFSKATAERISRDLPLPVEINARLPLLVMRSIDQWAVFLGKMQRRQTLVKNIYEREFGFLSKILTRSPVFITNWFELIHKKYGHLRSYTGPVMTLSFRPDSKLFRDHFWRDWSMEWSGDPLAFDTLLSDLCQKEF